MIIFCHLSWLVNVEMKGQHGFLSASDWPLYPVIIIIVIVVVINMVLLLLLLLLLSLLLLLLQSLYDASAKEIQFWVLYAM